MVRVKLNGHPGLFHAPHGFGDTYLPVRFEDPELEAEPGRTGGVSPSKLKRAEVKKMTRRGAKVVDASAVATRKAAKKGTTKAKARSGGIGVPK